MPNLIEIAQTDPTAAKKLANIKGRAERLFQNGYTCQPFYSKPTNFYVDAPNGAGYIVLGLSDGAACNCPCYKENEVCKHALAIQNILDKEAALIAHYETVIAGAEHEETGCDAYAEF